MKIILNALINHLTNLFLGTSWCNGNNDRKSSSQNRCVWCFLCGCYGSRSVFRTFYWNKLYFLPLLVIQKLFLLFSLLSFVENFPLLFILESKKLYFYFLNSSLFNMRIFFFGGSTCTGTRTHVSVGRLVKSQQSEPLDQPCPWNNKIRIIHASVFTHTHTHTSWELVLCKFTKYKSGAKYLFVPRRLVEGGL